MADGVLVVPDALEQIVGDIDDEHDPEEDEGIQAQDNGRVLVLALTRIDDFNEYFGLELSDDEYDTVGGLIMHELGRLPRRVQLLRLPLQSQLLLPCLLLIPFLILFTAFVGQAILLEASLSYLGMGVQEPTPAWGLMLQGGAEEYAESAPWVAIWPGVAISLAVFGFNLFGDSVRDTLDPKLRSR